MSRRILFFSDPIGTALTRAAAPWFKPIGVVMAAIRPDHFSEMRAAADFYGVPLLIQPRHTSDSYREFFGAVKRLESDMIFVNSYSMILRDDVLGIAPSGAVNVHGGPLPEFRGANPVEWGLIGETTFAGVSAHFIDSGIDSGDLIAVRRVPVTFEDTWRDVRRSVLRATDALLPEILTPLVKGDTLPRAKQDESQARYYKRRNAADGTISWQAPIRTIHNMVRALVSPHPGTFVDGPASTSHLVRYHTLRELAAAKFAALGGDVWATDSFRLVPAPMPAREREPICNVRVMENRSLQLGITDRMEKLCGDCGLHFDWSRPSSRAQAILQFADNNKSSRQKCTDLIRDFCRREFLREVDVSFQ